MKLLMYFVGILLFFIILICVLIYADSRVLANYEYKELKLLKKSERKNKVLYVFADVNKQKEYIIKLNKKFLSKKHIPNEFLIEKSSKAKYYNHLKSYLEINKSYIIALGTYGEISKTLYILNAKKIEKEDPNL